MKIQLMSGFVLAALLSVSLANAECVYPKVPSGMPDGSKATEQEMLDGMKAVKAYNTEVTAYLNCLDMEMQARLDAAGAEAPADQIAQIKAIQTKRHNAAVEELEAHAARFNEQVKAYKARDKDKAKKG
jgi:hypothetical protein